MVIQLAIDPRMQQGAIVAKRNNVNFQEQWKHCRSLCIVEPLNVLVILLAGAGGVQVSSPIMPDEVVNNRARFMDDGLAIFNDRGLAQ